MMQTSGLLRPMRAVADEAGLRAAIQENDACMELTSDLYLTQSAHIEGAVTLDGRHHTIRRAAGFTGPLFHIHDGALTLRKITLDGYRARTAPGGALVLVQSGTLMLEYGAALQNNHASAGGGAVRLETGHGAPSCLRMLADSVIRDCQSDAEGGGIYAQFADAITPGFVRIAGSSVLCGNAAMAGGALAVRHQSGGQGIVLIESGAHLTDNTAAGHGGGIFYANDGPEAPTVALRIGGTARIQGNRAAAGNARGGGVYLRSANPNDRLIVGERAVITENRAHTGGGLCVESHSGRAHVLLTGGRVEKNRADGADDDVSMLP